MPFSLLLLFLRNLGVRPWVRDSSSLSYTGRPFCSGVGLRTWLAHWCLNEYEVCAGAQSSAKVKAHLHGLSHHVSVLSMCVNVDI